jgi:uncharacterized membrane protein
VLQVRHQREEEATAEERLAEAITRVTGACVRLTHHLAFFGFWIVPTSAGSPGVPA